ncbi:hypothetical protein N9F18_00780, partial [bacterium]|nr:hypothetical protein [bacterium]
EDTIRERLREYYHTGGGNTFYLGFKGLGSLYSIKEGGCTDWSGLPGSGKTEVLLDSLKFCSRHYKHKHLIHMPDAGTVEEVIGKLIHKMSGKQFEEFYFDSDGNKRIIENRVTEDELEHYLPIVLEYFKILDPEKSNNSKALTPKEFWQFAADNKKELGIFSGVIDSWNYMKHDVGALRYDQWLEETLSFRNELAERNDLHFHTIIHPKSGKKVEGKVPFPDMHDLKGGSEWSNNGKSIIIVHREFGSMVTDIKVNKAKPRIVGVQGLTALQYDMQKGAFYEHVNGEKFFASPAKEEINNSLNDEANRNF